MSDVFAPPRHPLVVQALADARIWCAGHVIDDRPALVHAVRVAVTLVRYRRDINAEVVAAALLHDSPEFAPSDLDLNAVLESRYGPRTRQVVRSLEAEHLALDTGRPVIPADPDVLVTSTADKIVALRSLLHRARKSGDVTGFFATRPLLRGLFGHFSQFTTVAAAAAGVPVMMARELRQVLLLLTDAASTSASN